jgi:hypothetical protein
MEKITQLHAIYEAQLKPSLEGLDKVRLKVRNLLTLSVFFLAIAFTTITITSLESNILKLEHTESLFVIIPIFILLLFAALISFIFFSRLQKKYRTRYKQEVSSKIFEVLAPHMQYEPDSMIPSNQYMNSGIFKRAHDRYTGDDLLSGKIDDVNFYFSEVHSQYKEITLDKDRQDKESWHTIFHGLFIITEFNKNIQHDTFILPDRAEKIMGRLGSLIQKSQRARHAKHLIKLENPTFEKNFVVYGDDQIESRYILTPSVMESFVKIQKAFNKPLYASFRGNQMYMAIDTSLNMFEPTIFRSGASFTNIEKMANLIEVSTSIVQELQLNKNIWNKKK